MFRHSNYNRSKIKNKKNYKKIKIYSFDGKDITSKCKEQVDELSKKHFGDCILDGSLILFNGDDALNRAETISYLSKKEDSEGTLKMHLFDLLRHEEKYVKLFFLFQILTNGAKQKKLHAFQYLNLQGPLKFQPL